MYKYQYDILNIIDNQTSNKIKELIFNEFNTELSFFEDLLFRKRLSYSLNFQQIKPIDLIEKRRVLNKEQFEIILHFLYPDETELFRDTDSWLLLKSDIFYKLNSQNRTKILIYNSTTGENLYSVIILLNELNILDNFNITVTSPSSYSVNKIINGIVTQPKNRSSIFNFKNVVGNDCISKYFEYNNNELTFNKILLKKVKVIKTNPFENNLEEYDLVLFRNKALSIEQEYAKNLFLEIHKHVKLQGYLIIGTNENLSSNISSIYKPFSINEKIFQKNEQ